jgi:hypothetical protein
MDLFALLLAIGFWEFLALLIALGIGILVGIIWPRKSAAVPVWPFETCATTGKEGVDLISEIFELAVAANAAGTLPPHKYEWIKELLAQCMQHDSLHFQKGNSSFDSFILGNHCKAVEKALQHATAASVVGNPNPEADWDLAISELEHGG